MKIAVHLVFNAHRFEPSGAYLVEQIKKTKFAKRMIKINKT